MNNAYHEPSPLLNAASAAAVADADASLAVFSHYQDQTGSCQKPILYSNGLDNETLHRAKFSFMQFIIIDKGVIVCELRINVETKKE